MNRSFTRLSLIGVSLVALACSQAACTQATDEAVDTSAHDIVGGTVAADGAWPGAVALYIQGMQACGGALVADQWVITAGHCILSPSSPNGGIQNVVIGRQKLSSSGGDVRTVDHAYRHPGFTQKPDNDIALLHLSTPSSAPKAKVVSASQLASIVDGANVTVVGWGLTSEYGSQTSDSLRQVTVPIVSNASCNSAYRSYGGVTNNNICAGLSQGGKDSCQGDSGGPLFMNIGGQNVQIGLVSWGVGCAEPNLPGVYTRVGNYLDWMRTTSGGAIGAASASSDAGADASSDAGGGHAFGGGPFGSN